MRATEAGARVVREGEALRFHGPVLREHVATLWLSAMPLLAGARTLDLAGVDALDSAGLALFGELMQRNATLQLAMPPPADLDALRQAYRLDARLQPLA
jgi:phospholipid transport system transporter-binding protein